MKRFIDKGWLAFLEPENTERYDYYSMPTEKMNILHTDIPALLSDIAPKATTPIWFYRKLNISDTDHESRIFVCFDQVICLCEVFLNGRFVGRHIHSEEKFEFDITDYINEGENILACRVYGPVTDKIGPYGISMKTVPSFAQVYSYYTVIPKTGIYGHVYIDVRPAVFISDVYLIPDLHTGTVKLELSVSNISDRHVSAKTVFEISWRGETLYSYTRIIESDSGQDIIDYSEFTIEDIMPWTPDSPNLYDISISVSGCGFHKIQKRFGFKDFRVENGWFMLNGKRIWLTSAHTFHGIEEVVHAKTMGFKMLRYLTAVPSEEILSFCDEIGMMVYEEPATSWGMHDYPGMEKDMAAYIGNMIKRDRNHVSVAVWGLFNEQPGSNKEFRNNIIPETSKVFDFAVLYLQQIRKVDNTRLILLSSGRWDARLDIGSYSNPGKCVWEYGWGDESPEKAMSHTVKEYDVSPYVEGMGDNHLYPKVPFDNKTVEFIRNIGSEDRPVFISEFGVGCQYDLQDAYLDLLKNNIPDHPSLPYYKVQIDCLNEFVDKYDMDDIYPTARDFLMESIKSEAEARRESISLLRSNPGICGYSMTSFGISNEGVYYRKGCIMPGVVDALRDSFAPVRWAIFTDHTEIYTDTQAVFEIVLCSMDIMDPGDYTASVSVSCNHGVIWRDKISFKYPGGNRFSPLAVPVAKIKIPALQTGEYKLNVNLDNSIQPICGDKIFRVYEHPRITSRKLYCIGMPDKFIREIAHMGAEITDSAEKSDIVLIGSDSENNGNLLSGGFESAAAGANVIFLDDSLFDVSNTTDQAFMGKAVYETGKTLIGSRIYYRNWLYHLDSYIADTDISDGISSTGLVDMNIYRKVYPDHYFVDTEKPTTTYCAAFGSGLFAKDNCIYGLVLGKFTYGKGSITVNTFKLINNIGEDPIVDILFRNILCIEYVAAN